MSRVEHIKWSLAFVHRALRDACNGTNEQIHFVPDFGSHSIAWCLWHTTRVEDMIVNVRIKETDPIWSEEWAKKTGLPFDGNGNGQSDEDAQKVKIINMKNFIDYQELVWESTARLLKELADNDLSKEVKARNGTETIDESILILLKSSFT